jgi:hypothetical protein
MFMHRMVCITLPFKAGHFYVIWGQRDTFLKSETYGNTYISSNVIN